MIHKIQLAVTMGVFTGVWSNLYINYKRLNINKIKDEENQEKR